MKNRVLFISAHFPSPIAKYAGHKIAFEILEDYSKKNDVVDLIVSCNKGESDLSNIKQLGNINIIDIISLTKFEKIKNIILSRKIFPLKVMSRYSSKITNYIKNNIDLYKEIHFEFTHAAFALTHMDEEIFKNKKITITCHDILIQTSLREGIKNFFNILPTYNFEKKIFSLSTNLIVLNKKDKSLASSLYNIPENQIYIFKPALSNFIKRARNLRMQTSKENILLFWGAMDRKENVEAVLIFFDMYEEYLKKKQYKLYVVGANPDQKLLKIAKKSENIIVTGFVDDPSVYFAKAKFGIVPLLKGGGIKIKTLEMLEAGLPVISTPVGAEGIEKTPELLVGDIDKWMLIFNKLL